jgi:hypothetical protein
MNIVVSEEGNNILCIFGPPIHANRSGYAKAYNDVFIDKPCDLARGGVFLKDTYLRLSGKGVSSDDETSGGVYLYNIEEPPFSNKASIRRVQLYSVKAGLVSFSVLRACPNIAFDIFVEAFLEISGGRFGVYSLPSFVARGGVIVH